MNYEQTENHRQYAFRKQKIYELEGQCSVLQKYYDRITELLDTPASGGYTTVTKDDYRRFIKSSPNAFDRDDFRSVGATSIIVVAVLAPLIILVSSWLYLFLIAPAVLAFFIFTPSAGDTTHFGKTYREEKEGEYITHYFIKEWFLQDLQVRYRRQLQDLQLDIEKLKNLLDD